MINYINYITGIGCYWYINDDYTTSSRKVLKTHEHKGNFMYLEGSPNDEDGQQRNIYLNIDNLDMIYKEGDRLNFVFKDGTKTYMFYPYLKTNIDELKSFFRKKIVKTTFENSDNLTYC